MGELSTDMTQWRERPESLPAENSIGAFCRAEGAAAERAAIVAWLRARALNLPHYAEAYTLETAAVAINSGKHLPN